MTAQDKIEILNEKLLGFNKKFKIIYQDSPYKYADQALAGNRGSGCKYDTLTIEEIKQIKIKEIADENCFLFFWATWPLIREAFEIIDAYNFDYKTIAFLWIKRNATGTIFKSMGSYTRANSEPLLLATRGKPKVITHRLSQIIETQEPEIIETVYKHIHSKKPDIFRQRITQLCGNISRIETFGRTLINDWTVIGNDEKLQLQPLEQFNETKTALYQN